MGLLHFAAGDDAFLSSDAPRTHPRKMRSCDGAHDCAAVVMKG
jgi:hypothetical protein